MGATAAEHASRAAGWRFWIDRGGTFTDVVAQAPDGSLRIHKLLSEDPERYGDAAIEGVRRLLGLRSGGGEDGEGTGGERGEPIPAGVVAEVRMGTTVATNALLEREGTPTLYVTTSGFGDALRIGYQDRPDIFALDIRLPAPAYARVLEVDERVGADGQVIRPLDEEGRGAGSKKPAAPALMPAPSPSSTATPTRSTSGAWRSWRAPPASRRSPRRTRRAR